MANKEIDTTPVKYADWKVNQGILKNRFQVDFNFIADFCKDNKKGYEWYLENVASKKIEDSRKVKKEFCDHFRILTGSSNNIKTLENLMKDFKPNFKNDNAQDSKQESEKENSTQENSTQENSNI